MLYFYRTDVSKGIDDNKTSASKVCDICHYWYFLNFSFSLILVLVSLLVFLKFQPNIYNRCHDLLMMSFNLSDIDILNIKVSDYRCIISLISKNQAINFIQNADLTKKAEHYKV